MDTVKPLPWSPHPLPLESLGGWTDRVAHAHGLNRTKFWARIGAGKWAALEFKQRDFRLADWRLSRLAQATNRSPSELDALLPTPTGREVIPKELRGVWVTLSSTLYCPVCITDRARRTGWCVSLPGICVDHRLWLRTSCQACQKPVDLRGRTPLTTFCPSCGSDLAGHTADEVVDSDVWAGAKVLTDRMPGLFVNLPATPAFDLLWRDALLLTRTLTAQSMLPPGPTAPDARRAWRHAVQPPSRAVIARVCAEVARDGGPRAALQRILALDDPPQDSPPDVQALREVWEIITRQPLIPHRGQTRTTGQTTPGPLTPVLPSDSPSPDNPRRTGVRIPTSLYDRLALIRHDSARTSNDLLTEAFELFYSLSDDTIQQVQASAQRSLDRPGGKTIYLTYHHTDLERAKRRLVHLGPLNDTIRNVLGTVLLARHGPSTVDHA